MDRNTQHNHSLSHIVQDNHQILHRRRTKSGTDLGQAESRSLELDKIENIVRRQELFHGLHISRLCIKSKETDNIKVEEDNGNSHIPSIPTPDYHQDSKRLPSPPTSPPSTNDYSNARHIWGNAERYKGSMSEEDCDQSAEMYREIISAMQSREVVPPPFSRYRMLGYGQDVATRVRHMRYVAYMRYEV